MAERFIVGQRVINESEPDLGLGIVASLPDGRSVEIAFPACDEARLYRIQTAPLRRVVLKLGHEAINREGFAIRINRVTEQNGLLTYYGPKSERMDEVESVPLEELSSQDRQAREEAIYQIPEPELNDRVPLTGPLDRLHAGNVGSVGDLQMRLKGWRVRAALCSPRTRGLAGARVGLLAHQLYLSNRVSKMEVPRVLLADEVGLGKTIEAGLIFCALRSLGRAGRVLVILPDSLVHQWLAELVRRFNELFTLVGPEAAKEANPFDNARRALVPWSALKAGLDKQACRHDWDLLIVDEAHHLHEGQQAYQVIESIAKHCRGMLLLTGTPTRGGQRTEFGLLKLVDPNRFSDYDSFLQERQRWQQVSEIVQALNAIGCIYNPEKHPVLFERLLALLPEDEALARCIEEFVQVGKQAEGLEDSKICEEAYNSLVHSLIDRHGSGRVLVRNRRERLAGLFPGRIICPVPLEHRSNEVGATDSGAASCVTAPDGAAATLRAQGAEFSDKPDDSGASDLHSSGLRSLAAAILSGERSSSVTKAANELSIEDSDLARDEECSEQESNDSHIDEAVARLEALIFGDLESSADDDSDCDTDCGSDNDRDCDGEDEPQEAPQERETFAEADLEAIASAADAAYVREETDDPYETQAVLAESSLDLQAAEEALRQGELGADANEQPEPRYISDFSLCAPSERPKHQQAHNDPRSEWLAGFLQSHPDQKVLVIAKRKQVVLALQNYLRDGWGIHAGVFHEELSLIYRDKQAAWFADPGGTQVLLCSEIGSEGRNFQFAHHLVFWDLPVHPDVVEQRIGRLDRIGQTQPVNIHVLYFKGGAEERLFEWHQRLGSFMGPVEGGEEIVREVKLLESLDSPNFSQVVERSEQLAEHYRQRARRNVDCLVDLNSFDPAVGEALQKEIEGQEKASQLKEFILQLLDRFRVTHSELSTAGIHSISPGNMMACDSVPGLKSDGMLATFDRQQALEREDLEFLSPEHPMVSGLMSMYLDGSEGTASAVRWKGAGKKGLILQCLFILEAMGNKRLELQRYLVSTPFIINIALDGSIFKGTIPEDDALQRMRPAMAHAIWAQAGKRLELLTQRAEAVAAEVTVPLIKKARLKAQQVLANEQSRLEELARLNPAVTPLEVATHRERLEQVELALSKATVRLDSVRMIYLEPDEHE